LSHGHFDKLNINLFDKGNEILTDYGSVRFIGIEQKFGGRYLPENTAYAGQTIAHNTLVVDETSQFNADEKTAEKYHADKLFSNISSNAVQVVSAKEDNAYKGVHLQRTLYMLELPGGKKIIADIFNTASSGQHQYDLPFQFSGNLINTTFRYKAATKKQETLGTKNGYQFLWKEAETDVKDTLAQFTFLNNRTYYSISSLIQGDAQLFFTRTGANDPDFNLRREPAYIIRKKGSDQSFINVIEIHGNFDPVIELSTDTYPSVKAIKLLQDDALSVVSITIEGKELLIAQCNKDFSATAKHTFNNTEKNISWTGPYTILYDGKTLK
jgi:hypothetical protein